MGNAPGLAAVPGLGVAGRLDRLGRLAEEHLREAVGDGDAEDGDRSGNQRVEGSAERGDGRAGDSGNGVRHSFTFGCLFSFSGFCYRSCYVATFVLLEPVFPNHEVMVAQTSWFVKCVCGSGSLRIRMPFQSCRLRPRARCTHRRTARNLPVPPH